MSPNVNLIRVHANRHLGTANPHVNLNRHVSI